MRVHACVFVCKNHSLQCVTAALILCHCSEEAALTNFLLPFESVCKLVTQIKQIKVIIIVIC